MCICWRKGRKLEVAHEECHLKCRVVSKEEADGEQQKWLVLEESCADDEVIVTVWRDLESTLPHAQSNTLQVSDKEHLNFGRKVVKINHSSNPNVRIEILSDKVHVRAIGAMKAGTFLMFNYNTTEWDMARSFTDCVSGEKVQGFSHLSSEEKQKLLATNLVATHIRELHGEV